MDRSEIWSAVLIIGLLAFIVWGHFENQDNCKQYQQVEVTGE